MEHPHETENENGITYNRWLDRADSDCLAISGVDLDSLGDAPPGSWDAWHDGTEPRDHVIEKLEENGYPFEAAPKVPPRPTVIARPSNDGQRIEAALRTRKVTGQLPVLY